VLSEDKSDLFEVACLDCNSTKSYFTAQGVAYFKMNHEGHRLRVREPGREEEEGEKKEATSEPAAEGVYGLELEQAPDAVPTRRAPLLDVQVGSGPTRLGNLVVDVVEEEAGRAVKVFGVAGGMERFTKGFAFKQVDDLNAFLESGVFADPATGMTYTWSPDKIDISMDVVKMIEEPKEEGADEATAPLAPELGAPQVIAVQEVKAPEAPKVPSQAPAAVEPGRAQAPAEEVLLGKLSYVQPGDEYRDASVRVSRVLRKYRWNTEPPYVIGAIFDDLMSIQSQTGMFRASAIRSVAELGYEFIAVESPSGVVTAWFKKRNGAGCASDDEPLEFTPPAMG
jgi:hypothetical protein